MKYKIGNEVKVLTAKTSGKDYKRFAVKDEKGVVTEDVVAFSTFQDYSRIAAGAEVEGILTEKDYQGRKSYTLNSLSKGGVGVAKAMEAKKEMIESAQDRKNTSIQNAQERNEVMWAKKSAMELLTFHPSYKGLSDEDIRASWMKLVEMILNFDPKSELSALEKDALQVAKSEPRVEPIDDSEIPF